MTGGGLRAQEKRSAPDGDGRCQRPVTADGYHSSQAAPLAAPAPLMRPFSSQASEHGGRLLDVLLSWFFASSWLESLAHVADQVQTRRSFRLLLRWHSPCSPRSESTRWRKDDLMRNDRTYLQPLSPAELATVAGGDDESFGDLIVRDACQDDYYLSGSPGMGLSPEMRPPGSYGDFLYRGFMQNCINWWNDY